MKRLMLIGAILGFGSGFGLGWLRQSTTQDMFWHACVAAYGGGLLMRWWGRFWFHGLRQSYQDRLTAAAAAAAAAEKADATVSPSRS